MKLDGKKVLFLGDSITEGCGASAEEYCFVSLVAQNNPLAKVYNYGVGGTRIAPQRAILKENGVRDDFLFRADGMVEDADLICVFGGTNDYCHGDAPLGKFGDVTQDSFYGSYHALVTKLLNRYPTAKIILFTPLHRAEEDEPVQKIDGTYLLADYVEAVRKIADEFSLPLLDLWKVSGIQPKVAVMRQRYMPDGLHPNDDGYYRIYQTVQAFIDTL